jgi:hypothetical protein
MEHSASPAAPVAPTLEVPAHIVEMALLAASLTITLLDESLLQLLGATATTTTERLVRQSHFPLLRLLNRTSFDLGKTLESCDFYAA